MHEFQRGLHELLCKVAKKDEAAFTQMYESIHRVCVLTILRDFSGMEETEAEAIFNQAMLKIWLRAGSYQGRSGSEPDVTAWAWVRITLLRTAQDVSRMIRKRGIAEIMEGDMHSESGSSESIDVSPLDRLGPKDVAPAEQVVDNPAVLFEDREGMAEFLASLSERERMIMGLLAAGKSQAEVAAMLGMSASRLSQIVHSLRQKALKFLRR